MKQLSLAAHNYHDQNGNFPPGDWDGEGLLGAFDGYIISYRPTPDGGFEGIGIPAALGKTGIRTFIIDERDRIREQASPRGEAIQKKMFADINNDALELVESFFDLDSRRRAVQELNCLMSSEIAARAVFNELNSDGDEKVTILEILSAGDTRGGPLSAFIQKVRERFEFGAGGEDLSTGVTLEELLEGKGRLK